MFVPSISDMYRQQDYDIVRTPKKKDSHYYLANCIGMYAIHIKEKGGVPYSDQGRYTFLREFGCGKQSEDRYKDYFTTDQNSPNPTAQVVTGVDGASGFTQSPDAKRRGYMNIFWKVVSPASKIMATLLGKFEKAEYDIKVNPIDSQSGSEIENKMLELWATKENIAFLRTFNDNMGLKFDEPEFMPETIDELKLFRDRGGFKAEHSMFMEQLIKWTAYVSRLKEIKKDVITDVINLGIGVVKDYYDTEDNTVKTRYIDPAKFFIQYSKFSDFRDAEFAGHSEDMTISEIRLKMIEEGIPENVYEPMLNKCAKNYQGTYGNPTQVDWQSFATPNEIGGWKYDFYKVLVCHCEWVDVDEVRDLIKTNRYGKQKLIPDVDEKTKEKENQKLNITHVRKRFRCSWLVGSELIYDYGIDQNITRPNKKDVYLSYHAYKLPFTSITDQLIPIYDNFNIIWDKYQNAIAMAVNSGRAIDWDSIASLDAAGKNTIEENLRRYFETGTLIYKKTDARGVRVNNQLPVQELKGGLGEAVNDALLQFKLNFQLIENLTGLNPLSLGSVNPNDPVKTSEIAVSSTSDTLRPILSGWMNIKENMAKNVCLTIQLLLKYDVSAQQTYSEIIGKRGIEVMQIAEGNAVKYGITLEARPSDAQKAKLANAAEVALQSGRNGQPGITLADYFAINRILDSGGSLLLAEMMLESSIRKNKETMAKQAQQNSIVQAQAQTQQAQMVEQIKTQGELAIIQEKGKQERETLTAKAYYDALLMQDKSQADMTIRAIEGYIKSGQLFIPPQEQAQGQPQQPSPQEQQAQQQQAQQQPVPQQ